MSARGPVVALVSKAPDDPAKKREWADAMTRVQIAMWIDGKFACAQCGHVFESVDDFIQRGPRFAGRSAGGQFLAVDDACWSAWEARS